VKLWMNNEGVYYMKRPIPGIGWVTWHVTWEGAQFLERKRIGVGHEIPKRVFDELQKKGYLYTYESGPSGEVELSSARTSKRSGKKQEEEISVAGILLVLFILFVVYQMVK
jgi:hypothetical protein